MKFLVAFALLVIVVVAEPPVPSSGYLPANAGPPSGSYGPPSGSYGPPGGGRPNTQYGAPNGGGGDDQNEPANYQFQYAVKDDESGNDFGHEESRQGDVAKGKYYVLLPDGRKQTVEYTADNDGYHPMVSYEEGQGGGYPGGGYPKQNGNGNGGYRY